MPRDFTANIARRKMEEQGQPKEKAVIEVEAMPEMVEAGPFRVGILPTAHSIPETSAVVIDTPAGRVLHTGDFKLDKTPLLGAPFDESGLGRGRRARHTRDGLRQHERVQRTCRAVRGVAGPDIAELVRAARRAWW